MSIEPSAQLKLDPLDKPIHGAEAFAQILNIVNAKGEPDLRRTFYLLERGHICAEKWGRSWVSTPRKLLGSLLPQPDKAA
jgi:hypothetical protein